MEGRMEFHILSFEGPDPYSRAGGLASRVAGLALSLAEQGFETHLWFIGDPEAAGEESWRSVHLHRWCQWISRREPAGVYAGEEWKRQDYVTSLPLKLCQLLEPRIQRGGRAVILAEEWQTADAVLHLHWLLSQGGIRNSVRLFWNANNTFGFDRIDFPRLQQAAIVTTVSRYMKHLMAARGVRAIVIPNGLDPTALETPARSVVRELRRRVQGRTLLVKMGRFDPGKGWLDAIAITAGMKRLGWRPLLLARGGPERHGREVLAAARRSSLHVVERSLRAPGARGLFGLLSDLEARDVIHITTEVEPVARRALFRSADIVLANSLHEPFGLVGLEVMGVGGLVCTGSSGEDYAQPGRNALVLETQDPQEFLGLFAQLRRRPRRELRIRAAGRATARQYRWREIVEGVLLPRIELLWTPRRITPPATPPDDGLTWAFRRHEKELAYCMHLLGERDLHRHERAGEHTRHGG
jgi:glycosyltransferase involved in cell wall biosynthesis